MQDEDQHRLDRSRTPKDIAADAEEEVRPVGVCRGYTKNGQPCRSATVGVDGLCRQHSKIEDVDEWRLDAETASSLAGDPLAWIEADDPRRLRHPEEWTTPNAASGHTLCGPRCQSLTAQKERCRAAASVAVEGKVFCGQHSPSKLKAKAEGKERARRGGSLRNRLKASVDEQWAELEEQLMGIATGAMTEKSFNCTACRRRNVVVVADAATRLRAQTELLSRTGAHAQSAASKVEEEGEVADLTLDKIAAMDATELRQAWSWLVASDGDLLRQTVNDFAALDAIRSERGSSELLEAAILRNEMHRPELREIYETLREIFEPTTITA